MPDDEKLKIALEALMKLKQHPTEDRDDAWLMRDIAVDALREIQRSHYLGEPSPVVADLVGARSL